MATIETIRGECVRRNLAWLRENLADAGRRANPADGWGRTLPEGTPEWAEARAYLDAADRVETVRVNALCACPECEECFGRCATARVDGRSLCDECGAAALACA